MWTISSDDSEDKKQALKIGREPLSVQTASVMRSAIMDGEFVPGEKLVEQALARKYKISRHVVREALHILEGEGLVVSDAFCGRSVFKPTTQQIQGAYLLRISLEMTAAALAAYKATPQQAMELKDRAQLPGDMRFSDLVEWDVSLHQTIWKIADEPLLTQNLEKMVWTIIKVGPLLEVTPEAQSWAVERSMENERSGGPSSHAPLVKAICQSDPPAARKAMLDHFLTSIVEAFSKETMDTFAAAFSVYESVRSEPGFPQH